jgi:hypothetical protein
MYIYVMYKKSVLTTPDNQIIAPYNQHPVAFHIDTRSALYCCAYIHTIVGLVMILLIHRSIDSSYFHRRKH